jgi:hypothetical protein
LDEINACMFTHICGRGESKVYLRVQFHSLYFIKRNYYKKLQGRRKGNKSDSKVIDSFVLFSHFSLFSSYKEDDEHNFFELTE